MTLPRNDSGPGLRTTVTRVHAICCVGEPAIRLRRPVPGVFLSVSLLALVCQIGATRWPSRLWNAALLVAHQAPLSITVIANDVFVPTNSQHMAETVALLWKAPFFTKGATAR